MLVLADNFLLLYLGWEGVGLCSYLLIGFWYERPAAASAAKKAFVTTRIGDAAMMLGIVLIFVALRIAGLRRGARRPGAVAGLTEGAATAISLLLLGRRDRQVGAVPAARLAPRRDGGTHARSRP